ncbi:nitrate- and nitrite sensing domain-containing protein [Yinghuangia soli]|uniref:histidine kinase n=1 Tax=Yinghuangia soli TaxID=2908204 RepID=A0AA41U2G3_9ACTN|nr:nitrate- and nitrite sensing domain-containing protein [Yinghuangia soli]MCF2528602.1 nitrate- and nitrite sensing domain-containing protein [Yinghuangia soli]
MRPPQELTASRAPAAPSRLKLLFSIKNWRIRTRITALLLLPVVVAALLGGLRIQSSVDKTREMDVVQKAGDVIDQSTTLVAVLEEERDNTAPILTKEPGAKGNQTVQDYYKRTNDQYERFRAAVAKMDLEDLPLIKATVNTIESRMAALGSVRKDAYSSMPFITIKQYQDIIENLLAINRQAPEITRDPNLIQGARALGLFGELKAYASAQRAAGAAYGSRSADVFPDAPEGFKALNAGEGDAIRAFKSIAPEELVKAYEEATRVSKSGDVAAYFLQMRDAMVTTDAAGKSSNSPLAKGMPDFSAEAWWKMSSGKLVALMSLETTMGDLLLGKADELRDEARKEALINTILVVAALLFTIILGVIVARSLVRSLNTLRRSALEIAEQRLPETVRRLSESEPGDVDLTVEPISVHSRDEVGQVARAFDAVHAEAVRLAAEQALLRGNVNSMFVNLSRRSQSLIQRQLALISDLENREADPDQLANLFKLDHLATRMRRNGENLLVLAGEEPGRRWTRPVPLVDVLRAAASEVEQYERVELGALPTTDIAGRAVNDLVHLLAELLENSTTFSSPHTKVRVTGHILPDGRALIEIHDNGIGLTGDDLADANQRLARPPVVDVSISRRMGLFVVGRLSTRHGIRVQLRPGDGGGTTALVMLPIELIQGDRPGGNWDKNSGRPAVAPGWEPDALTSSQEMQALPAAAAGPQRPGPDAGRSEPPRPLPQRGAPQVPAQPGAYEPASAFAEGPATHDTPFPGTPFPAQSDADNPFAPVSPQSPRGLDDARPAGGGTAQFPSPFGAPEPQPEQPLYDRPQYDQTQVQPVQADYAAPQTGGFGRPDYEQPYQQPRFDQEPAEHSGNDRGAGLPRRGGDTGAQPAVDPQRATAWSGPEYDSLSPVAPPAQVPAYEAPQRRPEPGDNGGVRPQSGDALPALRQPGMPERRQPADGRAAQQDPRALYRDGGQPGQAGQPGQQGQTGQFARPDQGRPAPQGQFGQAQPVRAQGLPAAPQAPQPLRQAPQQLPQARQLAAQPEPVDALDAPALPMAAEDERSPIFETLESDWFHRRTGRGGRMRAAQVRTSRPGAEDYAEAPDALASPAAPDPQTLDRRSPAATNPPLPQRAPEQAPQQASLPRRSHAGPAAPAETQGIPQQPLRQAAHAAPAEPLTQPAAQPGRPAAEQAPSGWYSAGDEGWRAAEAAREPASGGTTGAGLPRRVPRANLVPGGVGGNAPQAAGPVPGARTGGPAAPSAPGTPGGAAPVPPPGAPGLSRTPDDVRGRLTNFRRGIQQGRTAGGMAPQPRDENNQEQA